MIRTLSKIKTTWMLLAVLLLPIGAYAEGHIDFGDLPLPVQLVLTRINPMLQDGDYKEAIDVLLTFQARSGSVPDPGKPDPKGYHHPVIYFTLGNCYLLQEHHEPAAMAYRQVVARDATHTFAWLNLAKACYEMTRYAEAAHCFFKGYETAGGKNPEHLYYSAAAYLMAGDHVRSIQMFERLFASHPASVKPEWKENMVHALLAVNQPRRALPYIRELAAIYTGEKRIQWQEILLYQYMQLDMPKAALDLALTLTLDSPTVAKWWKALTHIRLNASQYKEALAALIMYSFLIPLTMEEEELMADLYMQLGIPVQAIPSYKNCLREKSNKQILQRLVTAYSQIGRPESALEVIDVLSPDPNDMDLMLLKGELLYTLKRFDEAAETYRQAAQNKQGEVGRAWLMAGYAAWQINDIAASKEAFAKAAQYHKEKNAAETALRQLARLPSLSKK